MVKRGRSRIEDNGRGMRGDVERMVKMFRGRKAKVGLENGRNEG